jgi:hypothetical protein
MAGQAFRRRVSGQAGLRISHWEIQAGPSEDHIPKLRSQVWALLEGNGIYGPAGEVRRSPDQIDFGFILSMAKLLGDPDWESLIPYGTTRVRLGVDIEMPRTPAVWPPKKRWPLAPI